MLGRPYGQLTPFDILDVLPNSDWEAIRKAYRSKHTGSYAEEGGNEELNKRLQWAMSQLKDPYLRQLWVAEVGGDKAEVNRLILLATLNKTITAGEQILGRFNELIDNKTPYVDCKHEVDDLWHLMGNCIDALNYQIKLNTRRANRKNRPVVNKAKDISRELSLLTEKIEHIERFDLAVGWIVISKCHENLDKLKKDKVVDAVWSIENETELEVLRKHYLKAPDKI